MKITEKIFDVLTGEETFIERDETSEEQKIREELEANIEAKKIENEAKALARKAILERLGLTEEEARLLLG